MIYFDNAATAKPCEAAIAALADCARNNFGNPSSLHSLGIAAETILASAKKTILGKFPEKNADFIFTSGATESNNLALNGLYNAYKRNGTRIVTTATEHKSVSGALERLSAEVVRLSPKDYPDADKFSDGIADAVGQDTIIAAVIAVNNETGYCIDAERLYKSIKRKNPKCIVHIDGVQAFLKVPIYGDTISVSAHKIHGIKGVGGLYVKKGIRLIPQTAGGGQQGGLRAGTEAVELVAAFETAVQTYKYDREHFTRLSDRLMQLLTDKIGVNNISINSRDNLPNIFNFSLKGIKSEIMTHFLAEKDVYVSSGSACAGGKKSEVLPHFGVSPQDIDSALRISFSHENTECELEIFAELLREAVKRFIAGCRPAPR